MSDDWTDALGNRDLSDPLRNIEAACTEMLRALDQGRYRHEPVHVRADLIYLRGEARRARHLLAASPTTPEASEAVRTAPRGSGEALEGEA